MTLVMTTSVSIGAFKTPMNLSRYLQTPIPLSPQIISHRQCELSPLPPFQRKRVTASISTAKDTHSNP